MIVMYYDTNFEIWLGTVVFAFGIFVSVCIIGIVLLLIEINKENFKGGDRKNAKAEKDEDSKN